MPNYPSTRPTPVYFLSILLYTAFFLGGLSCQPAEQEVKEIAPPAEPAQPEPAQPQKESFHSLSSNTIEGRFTPPPEFVRTDLVPTSFGHYLRNFPLYPADRQVHLFNGQLKGRQDVHAAVLDIDVGKRDLQQCADAIMRLQAEYLREQGRYQDIHFNFTNGFNAAYDRWRRGERINVSGNRVNWVSGSPSEDINKDWQRYLTMVFSYAGTLSLAKELKPVALAELQIGDVFIQGGSPGHAIIVVDKCVHPQTQEVAFLLAQSYMPAQDIHVLLNPLATDRSPWYFVSQSKDQVITPEWNFRANDLHRFPQNSE